MAPRIPYRSAVYLSDPAVLRGRVDLFQVVGHGHAADALLLELDVGDVLAGVQVETAQAAVTVHRVYLPVVRGPRLVRDLRTVTFPTVTVNYNLLFGGGNLTTRPAASPKCPATESW